MDDFKTSSQESARDRSSSCLGVVDDERDLELVQRLGQFANVVLNNPNTRSASVGTLVILTFVAPTIRAMSSMAWRTVHAGLAGACQARPKIARPGRR